MSTRHPAATADVAARGGIEVTKDGSSAPESARVALSFGAVIDDPRAQLPLPINEHPEQFALFAGDVGSVAERAAQRAADAMDPWAHGDAARACWRRAP